VGLECQNRYSFPEVCYVYYVLYVKKWIVYTKGTRMAHLMLRVRFDIRYRSCGTFPWIVIFFINSHTHKCQFCTKVYVKIKIPCVRCLCICIFQYTIYYHRVTCGRMFAPAHITSELNLSLKYNQ
jgi:hypothetical protein